MSRHIGSLGGSQEARSFGAFVRSKATKNGRSLCGFAQAHGLKQMTLYNYATGRQVPDLKLPIRLAAALRKETGENITLVSLLSFFDEHPGTRFDSGDFDSNSNSVLKSLKNLTVAERLAILPELKQMLAQDEKLATLNPRPLLAMLTREEKRKRSLSYEQLAKDVELPVEDLQAICSKRQPLKPMSQIAIRRFAANVRDENGYYGNVMRFAELFGVEND